MAQKKFNKKEFQELVKDNVKRLYRKTIEEATPQQRFQAVSYAVKEGIVDRWLATQEQYKKDDDAIKDAITKINTIVLRYLRSIPICNKASFAKINLLIKPVTNDAIPITKITAPPIPAAVSVFFETPRKGQIPRNWLNTTLLIIA